MAFAPVRLPSRTFHFGNPYPAWKVAIVNGEYPSISGALRWNMMRGRQPGTISWGSFLRECSGMPGQRTCRQAVGLKSNRPHRVAIPLGPCAVVHRPRGHGHGSRSSTQDTPSRDERLATSLKWHIGHVIRHVFMARSAFSLGNFAFIHIFSVSLIRSQRSRPSPAPGPGVTRSG